MPDDTNKADKYAQAVRIAQAAMTAVDPRGPAGHAITLATVAARPPVKHAPHAHVDTALHEDVIAQRQAQADRVRAVSHEVARRDALAAHPPVPVPVSPEVTAKTAQDAETMARLNAIQQPPPQWQAGQGQGPPPLPPMPPPLPDAYIPSAEARRAAAAMDAPPGPGWRIDSNNPRTKEMEAAKVAQDSETLRKLAMIQQEPPKWQAGSMTGMHFAPEHVVSKKEVDAASSKAEKEMDKRLSPAEYAEKVNDMRISGGK